MDTDTNTGDLRVEWNGGGLSSPIPFWISDNIVTGTLAIYNGPDGFRHDAPKLWFRSVYEYALATFADRNEDIYTGVSVDLGNVYNEEDDSWFVEFTEPCPQIRWASQLDQDQSFVLNQDVPTSDPQELNVMVYNLKAGIATLSEEVTNGRLQSVNLKYRKIGTGDWIPARTREDVVIDFAAEGVEDDYGYAMLPWAYEESNVRNGEYELRVEASCHAILMEHPLNMSRSLPLQLLA
jgi:hypothetical protein